MKIDLEERLSKALQGVNGEEQTVLIMYADNDADSGNVAMMGETFVLFKMFATVLNIVKRGGAEREDKAIAKAILAAVYDSYTIEELRDKYNAIDAIRAYTQMRTRKPIAKS